MIGNGNFEKFSRGSKKFGYDYEENRDRKKNKKELRRQRRLEKEQNNWDSVDTQENSSFKN